MNWGLFGIPRLGLRAVTRKDFELFYTAYTPRISEFDTVVNNYFRSN